MLRQALATLRVLANIQKRSKMPPMPGVTGWLIDSLDPLIERFHDRDARTRLKAQLQKMRDKGDIDKLSVLFDNPQIFQDDFGAFRNALKNYAALRQEHARLSEDLESNQTFGQGMGRQVAAMVSGIFAALIVVMYMVFKFSGGGG